MRWTRPLAGPGKEGPGDDSVEAVNENGMNRHRSTCLAVVKPIRHVERRIGSIAVDPIGAVVYCLGLSYPVVALFELLSEPDWAPRAQSLR